ncbi:MAG: hypothetical protein R2827_01645 [Bdellovibrionales bacterium]
MVFFATKNLGVFALPLRIYQQALFRPRSPYCIYSGNPPLEGATHPADLHSEKIYRPSDLELAEQNEAFKVLIERSPLAREEIVLDE